MNAKTGGESVLEGQRAEGEADAQEPAMEATVHAAGAMSEALERLERARGALYAFHQLVGSADSQLDEVVRHLRSAGRDELASGIRDTLIGRDVLPGRWTYQVIEEFDDGFYAAWREWERRLRHDLVGGRRHVAEAALKERRQRLPGPRAQI